MLLQPISSYSLLFFVQYWPHPYRDQTNTIKYSKFKEFDPKNQARFCDGKSHNTTAPKSGTQNCRKFRFLRFNFKEFDTKSLTRNVANKELLIRLRF